MAESNRNPGVPSGMRTVMLYLFATLIDNAYRVPYLDKRNYVDSGQITRRGAQQITHSAGKCVELDGVEVCAGV